MLYVGPIEKETKPKRGRLTKYEIHSDKRDLTV